MLFELIATISMGFIAAAVILVVQKTFRLSLPKWAMPVAAGLGMITFTVWSEYAWFDRHHEAIGRDKIIATKVEKSQPWRPWTYIFPVTTRFIALDKDGAEVIDGTVVTSIYLLSRWQDGAIVPAAFDCILSRRADLFSGRDDIKTKLATAEWTVMGSDDPTLRAACDQIRP